jgi:hypothetical protein
MLLNRLSRSQVFSRVVHGTCCRITWRLQFMYIINSMLVTCVAVGDGAIINICCNTVCTHRVARLSFWREQWAIVFLQLASRALKYVKCYPILFVTQSCTSKFCAVSFIYLTLSVIQTTKHCFMLSNLLLNTYRKKNCFMCCLFGTATHYLILSYWMAPSMPKITVPTDKAIVTIGLKVCGRGL